MRFAKFALFVLVALAATAADAPKPYNPYVAPASEEAQNAIKRFRVPKGFKVELFAAEPLLANPVAFHIDEQGRFFVAETFRLHTGVTDIRGSIAQPLEAAWGYPRRATTPCSSSLATSSRFSSSSSPSA